MRAKILGLLLIFFSVSVAEAQYAEFGAGLYGGLSACPYDYEEGDGAEEDSDLVHEYRQNLSKARKALKDAKTKQTKAKTKLKTARGKIAKVIKGGALSTVTGHMDTPNDRTSYGENCDGAEAHQDGEDDDDAIPAVLRGQSNKQASAGSGSNYLPSDDSFCYTINEKNYNAWLKYAQDGGLVDERICDEPKARFVNRSASYDQRSDCREGLSDYHDAAEELRDIGAEIADAKDNVKLYEGLIEDQEEAERIAREDDDDTEADAGCWWCRHHRRPSTIETVANVGLSVLGGVLAYKGAKYAIDQNSRLGWPTSPYLAAGMGYPFLMNGIYGAIGGGIGGGAFGCAGGAYGGGYPYGPYGMMSPYGTLGGSLYGGAGGAFGYPGGMFGTPYGNGLFMPGMYPGGGFPYGGFGIPGQFLLGGAIGGAIGMALPGMAGFAGMGYAAPGFPMPGFALAGGGAIGLAIGGGIPIGGLQLAGLQIGGFQLGGLQLGGLPIGGAIGGALGVAIPGMALGGLQIGGLQLAGLQLGGLQLAGLQIGGFQLGGLQLGGLALGGALGGGMAGFGGYDSQIYQQYASYMARVQQDYVAKQQTIMGLQEEISRIVLQIQQISYGSSGIGGAPAVLPYIGGGGGGGSGPMSTGR